MGVIKLDLKTIYDIDKPPFQKCPFCGYDEFYVKMSAHGKIYDRHRYDGNEAENGDMYDNLTTKPVGVYAYCDNCEKRLFRYR